MTPTDVASAPPETANKAWTRALGQVARIERSPERILPVVVEEQAAARPKAPALLSDHEQLTYGELASLTRRYGRWALAQGLAKGDTVALVGRARPGYLAAWLGLTGVGVVVALVNPELREDALAHSLVAAAPRLILVADDLLHAVGPVAERLGEPLPIWRVGSGPGALGPALQALPDHPLTADERRGVTVRDPALLIYTSGTTGLPKAARVSHRRLMSWSGWFAGLLDVRPDDRLYDCLPLHHSAGGVVAPGAMLAGGGAVVIAPKFSPSRFWDDVVRWDCTLFQYIGELCRYLLRAPPCASERRHRLRIACGNGLAESVWRPFEERFAPLRIVEFYAATEGNFSLYNLDGEPGAIGRVPAFIAHRFPVEVVRFDPAAGAPERGSDGRCIPCAPGEAGEAIARIGDDEVHAAQRFEGYTAADESEAKVLRDVFAPGDAWLRSGDLMRRDAKGFFRFVGRAGDSFRWKGENVSAAEVAAVLEACPGVAAAAVYGVSVPHADGQAGMAAVVPGEAVDLDDLRRRLVDALPSYARPVFLRLVAALPATETFKTVSLPLAAEGFDPARIGDRLYVADPATGAYRLLTPEVYEAIVRGARKL